MDPGLDPTKSRRFFEQKMESAFRATRKKEEFILILCSLMLIILKKLMIPMAMK